jgi:membrane fusion protein
MWLPKRGSARTTFAEASQPSTSQPPASQPPAHVRTRIATRPLFRQEVIEFQRAQRDWGRVVPLQPMVTRMSVWLVVLGMAATVGVSFVAQYSRKAAATGYLRAATGSARIYAPQPGVIDKIYVAEGQAVDAGQPLFTVTTGQVTASGQDVNATILASLRAHTTSVRAQIAVEQQHTESERVRFGNQVQTLQGEVAAISTQVNVQNERTRLYEHIVTSGAALAARGLVSELDQKRREDSVLDQRRTLGSLNEQLVARQGQLADARSNLDQLPFVHQEKIRSLTNDLTATEQRIAEVSGRQAYVVSTPITGDVALLTASVGQQADPKRLQAEIVPADHHLLAEVFVPAQSIGLVQPGQPVIIQYDTFPYLKYGTFKGTVAQVSHTAITPADNLMTPLPLKDTSYRVIVQLHRTDVTLDGKSTPLQPDMLLRADIILEKYTVAHWIINSIRMPG